MKQASLLGWLKEKPKKVERPTPAVAFRFLTAFPEGIMTPEGPSGPFMAGDLVSENVLPVEVWRTLLRHGVVERYNIKGVRV